MAKTLSCYKSPKTIATCKESISSCLPCVGSWLDSMSFVLSSNTLECRQMLSSGLQYLKMPFRIDVIGGPWLLGWNFAHFLSGFLGCSCAVIFLSDRRQFVLYCCLRAAAGIFFIHIHPPTNQERITKLQYCRTMRAFHKCMEQTTQTARNTVVAWSFSPFGKSWMLSLNLSLLSYK